MQHGVEWRRAFGGGGGAGGRAVPGRRAGGELRGAPRVLRAAVLRQQPRAVLPDDRGGYVPRADYSKHYDEFRHYKK